MSTLFLFSLRRGVSVPIGLYSWFDGWFCYCTVTRSKIEMPKKTLPPLKCLINWPHYAAYLSLIFFLTVLKYLHINVQIRMRYCFCDSAILYGASDSLQLTASFQVNMCHICYIYLFLLLGFGLVKIDLDWERGKRCMCRRVGACTKYWFRSQPSSVSLRLCCVGDQDGNILVQEIKSSCSVLL